MKTILASVHQATLILTGFTAAATLILGVSYYFAAPIIAENERLAKIALLSAIATDFDNDPVAESQSLPNSDGLTTIFPLRKENELNGIIFEVIAPDGYNGAIRLLVGVNRERQVIGVRVVSHSETPGFSDDLNVRRSDWIRQFDGKSLLNPPLERWQVRKDNGDFEQFTGATITPRAVVRSVANVLKYAESQYEKLFEETLP